MINAGVNSIGCLSFNIKASTDFKGTLYYIVTNKLEVPTVNKIKTFCYPKSSIVMKGAVKVDHNTININPTRLRSKTEYWVYLLGEYKENHITHNHLVSNPIKVRTTKFNPSKNKRLKLGPVLKNSMINTSDIFSEVATSDHRVTTQVDLIDPTLKLTGKGIKVGVIEVNYPRYDHPEFLDDNNESRISYGDLSIEAINEINFNSTTYNHATHVCGIIGSKGEKKGATGIAPECELVCYDSFEFINDMANFPEDVNICNHSYGETLGWAVTVYDLNGTVTTIDIWTGVITETDIKEDPWFGKYDSESKDIDMVLNSKKKLISVWSAGNDRNDKFTNASGTNQYLTYTPDEDNEDIWILSLVDGTEISPPGGDGGIKGYDTLGPNKTLKNNITIGSVHNFRSKIINLIQPFHIVTSSFSSYGPTDDGRVKPDLVTIGEDVYGPLSYSSGQELVETYGSLSGTSMSAPIATGVACLIVEQYKDKYQTDPTSATIKNILIHSAVSDGFGPNYRTGWGMIDAYKATTLLKDIDHVYEYSNQELNLRKSILLDDIDYDGEEHIYPLAMSSYPKEIKITVVWNDPAPVTITGQNELDPTLPMIVNKLKVYIQDDKEKIYRPWKLDPTDPNKMASRGENEIDNVQQIVVSYPDPSKTYTLHISHYGDIMNAQGTVYDYGLVDNGTQPYSVIISAEFYEVYAVYYYVVDLFFYLQDIIKRMWNLELSNVRDLFASAIDVIISFLEGLEDATQGNINES